MNQKPTAWAPPTVHPCVAGRTILFTRPSERTLVVRQLETVRSLLGILECNCLAFYWPEAVHSILILATKPLWSSGTIQRWSSCCWSWKPTSGCKQSERRRERHAFRSTAVAAFTVRRPPPGPSEEKFGRPNSSGVRAIQAKVQSLVFAEERYSSETCCDSCCHLSLKLGLLSTWLMCELRTVPGYSFTWKFIPVAAFLPQTPKKTSYMLRSTNTTVCPVVWSLCGPSGFDGKTLLQTFAALWDKVMGET